MYYTYIIQSITTGKLYIGHTDNIERRISEHNIGKSKSTRKRGPWKLIFNKEFNTKSEAIIFEL